MDRRTSLIKLSRNIWPLPVGRGSAFVIFSLSVVALICLHFRADSEITLNGVAWAPGLDHPAPVQSFVSAVHVSPGQYVETGDLLVTLDDHLLRRRLAELEVSIEITEKRKRLELERISVKLSESRVDTARRLMLAKSEARRKKANLARSRSLLESTREHALEIQRQVDSKVLAKDAAWNAVLKLNVEQALAREAEELMRMQTEGYKEEQRLAADKDDVEKMINTSINYYDAERLARQKERAAVLADLKALAVHAKTDGVVNRVLERGAAVEVGQSVAHLLPQKARDVIVYFPPETNPHHIAELYRKIEIAEESGKTCSGSLPLRVMAGVQQMSPPLAGKISTQISGLPVHVPLSKDCALGVGQVVVVTLEAK